MNDVPLPGPLDEFLNSPPRRAASESLRATLLRQTSRQVGRRRRFGRVTAMAAVAAALALTAFGVWVVQQQGAVTKDQPHAHHGKEVPAVEATAKPGPGPLAEHAPKSAPPDEPMSALALEWQAFDAPRAERAALYYQAGDRYLDDSRDVASAMRCYTVAIDATPMESLEIQPDDNWLVTTLKLDRIERRKEK
jgi:hypothetical protein